MHPGGSAHAPRRGRAPRAFVVRDPAPEDVGAPIDWSSWYLTDEEDMGESAEQGEIIRALLSALAQLAAERTFGDVYFGADNFFAWVEEEPLVRVSPDVYLLDEPPPPPLPKSWQTWLPGHRAPRWAVEIVSDDWKKDYEEAPAKYALLGTRELVIFDPAAILTPDRKGQRVPFQIYRRDADGMFVRVHRGDGPVLCEELSAWLVARRTGNAVRLRVARDAAGTDIVPTADEAKREADAARRNAEAATREADAAKRSAEDRVRALEEEIAKLRGKA